MLRFFTNLKLKAKLKSLLKDPQYPKGRSLAALADGIKKPQHETVVLLLAIGTKAVKLRNGKVGYQLLS